MTIQEYSSTKLPCTEDRVWLIYKKQRIKQMISKRMFNKAVSDFSCAVYVQREMCNAFNLFIVISTFPVLDTVCADYHEVFWCSSGSSDDHWDNRSGSI